MSGRNSSSRSISSRGSAMHDWQDAIREKLAGIVLSRCQREDLIAELANHLEDLHAELLASGITEPEASAKCLEQLNDVPQIAAVVKRSEIWEDAMNRRSRTFWLPGLITLTLASVSLMGMQQFTFSRPRVHWVDGGAVAVGFVWLASLLPCGALGAYLSRRAGASRWISIIASLFPSIVMLAVFCMLYRLAFSLSATPMSFIILATWAWHYSFGSSFRALPYFWELCLYSGE